MNDENKQTIADLEAEVRKELGITAPIQSTTDRSLHLTQQMILQKNWHISETLKSKIDTKITGMEGM